MRTTSRLRVLALAALAFLALGSPRASAEEGATLTALEIAHHNEWNAKLHYEVYARAAEREGLPRIANLFWAVARGESVHASNHRVQIDRLGGDAHHRIESVVVRTTAQNLARAVALEKEEWTTVYRTFAELARRECKYDALASFLYARSAERTHADVFAGALEELRRRERGAGQLASLGAVGAVESLSSVGPARVLICPGCGGAFLAHSRGSCAICGTACADRLVYACAR